MAGAAGSGDAARRRVFISHTFELRDFPSEKSYVAAVERAISAAGAQILPDNKCYHATLLPTWILKLPLPAPGEGCGL